MHNIVVLGTGLAAMPIIRQTMLNTVNKSSAYKLTVISPTTNFVWPIAMPRAVVPGKLADEKVMYPLEPAFAEFDSDKFEFIVGAAEKVDPDRKVVAVNGREVEYHTLIVATGSSTRDGFPWKTVKNAEETRKALHKTHREIEKADAVAIIGGGVTGSETAGELGYEYSRVGKKDVYLIYSGELPLAPSVPEKVRRQTVVELEKLNVKLLHGNTVTKQTRKANGQSTLELRSKDGSTKTLNVGAVVAATGLVPNTSFMPKDMLNSKGYIIQNTHLRTPSYSNIFVVGDAGSLDVDKASLAEAQTLWLVKHLPAYFDTGKLVKEPFRKEGEKAPVVDVLTLGPQKGAGHFNGWKVPSLLVWWVKGRHLGTDFAGEFAQGKRTWNTVF